MAFKEGLDDQCRPPCWARARFARTKSRAVSVHSTVRGALAAVPGSGNLWGFGFL